MKILLILLSFLFLNNSSVIHRDRILKIDKNGNIIGLPKKYSPAKFDLISKKLRIKYREVVFPKCLNYYFEQNRNPKITLSASWYHDKTTLPYYLNFDISNKSANYGYTILVNLETLELIYVSKSIIQEDTIYEPKVDLSKKCLSEYKSAIRIVK